MALERQLDSVTEDNPVILIVDDDDGISTLIQRRLGASDFVTHRANTCLDAISWLESNSPDLVLLDLTMPDMTGKEMIEKLSHDGVRIPFVVVSGQGDERIIVDMMKFGALDYIIKDSSLLELLPAVSTRAIEKSRQDQRFQRAQAMLLREAQIDSRLESLSKAILASNTIEEISRLTLDCAKSLTASEFAFVGYIDPETGSLICPTMTGNVWEKCKIGNENAIFEKFSGIWGWVLDNREPLLTNDPLKHHASTGVPEGHIPINRFVSVPCLAGDDLIGQIAVANSPRDYSQRDQEVIERLAGFYALAVQQKRSEQYLHVALDKARQHSSEISLLLDASNAIIEHSDFQSAINDILSSCNKSIRAREGHIYLANVADDENKVVFKNFGHNFDKTRGCLDQHISRMCKKVFKSKKGLLVNDKLPVTPLNINTIKGMVLAPLKLEGTVVGILCFLDKPSGFTEDDLRMASAFADIASVALNKSRAFDSLEHSENRYRSLTQSAADAIISVDLDGKIVSWNNGAENMFCYSEKDAYGQALSIIIPVRNRSIYQRIIAELRDGTDSGMFGRTFEIDGIKKDGSVFPIAVSLSKWQTGEEIFCTLIVRDITERRQTEEAMAMLAKFPDENPNPVLRISSNGKILYHNNAGNQLLEIWQCQTGDNLPDEWLKISKEILKSGQTRITELEGEGKIFSMTMTPIAPADYVNIYAMDVTERIAAEEALKKTHDELESRVKTRTLQLQRVVTDLQVEVMERIKAEQKILEDQKQLREMASELMLTEERERREIAVALHDSIGQILAFSSIALGNTLKKSPDGIQQQLTHVRQMIEQAITETRSLTFDLSPTILYTFGLHAAIEHLSEQFSEQHSLNCELQPFDGSIELSRELEILFYRATRELLANIVKHAEAENVEIKAYRKNGHIELSVRDDGKGFDLFSIDSVRGKFTGLGLFSIRERLAHMGGSLEINSNAGAGTTITLSAPLEKGKVKEIEHENANYTS